MDRLNSLPASVAIVSIILLVLSSGCIQGILPGTKDREMLQQVYESDLTQAMDQGKRLDDLYGSRPVAYDRGQSKDWLDKLRLETDAFIEKNNDAIESGRAYLEYIDNGSSEYNSILANETSLKDNIVKARDRYEKESACYDYNSKIDAMAMELDALEDMYSVRPGVANIGEYSAWAASLKVQYNKYIQACDDGIRSGEAYLKYLDTGSGEYSQVLRYEESIRKDMADAKARFEKENATLDYQIKLHLLIEQDKCLNGLYSSLPNKWEKASYRGWLAKLLVETQEYLKRSDDYVQAAHEYMKYIDPDSREYHLLVENEEVARQNIEAVKEGYNRNVDGYNEYYKESLPRIE